MANPAPPLPGQDPAPASAPAGEDTPHESNAGTPQAGGESVGSRLLALMQELRSSNDTLQGNQSIISQQMTTLQQFVGSCTQQTAISMAKMEADIARFRTGGTQQAMAAVFHRLFREFAGFAGQLEDLTTSARVAKLDASWQGALDALQGRFDGMLAQWGCVPVQVPSGVEFDPEIQESVEALPGEVPPDSVAHRVVSQRARGWALHGTLIKHPQVVVA